ncbi:MULTISPECIES: ABC transporter substrate-binding protein [unclassified Methanoculleus]|jgi:tRNA(Ile2) C34 agmatinyltransferase TiaS|uniref:ABC transporter substrate-binding protein n=1 Tax=Methanoculleus palmolei TaxID=72612 RepID=A0ABD8A8C1_9EURY|nr:ABC transporter substrate-binding protein [Methanoculleus sp. UBA377]MDD2472952.1 ABC transporter substrate-binding protein [Methanoculleus sp.]WOX55776.1 ABC transporter substrate-binding protein [Methanoculleus palmolei]
MTIYLGIDDTDTCESRGTGRLARTIAAELAGSYVVTGVTRHQFYVHPAIPYTSHNSSAVIHIQDAGAGDAAGLFTAAKELMLADFVDGSDPGICVAADRNIDGSLRRFGLSAKTSVVTQEQARSLARQAGILLEGLGGTEDGVIGALAGVGLAASGNDGRFVQKGTTRDLRGTRTVAAILASGVDRVETREGAVIEGGVVALRKFPKPAFVGGKAVLYVEPDGDVYRDVVIG